ncbi:MAG: cation:proton antiporter [Ilumatobacter sp.]|uniref:cation:proton antiporter n=1 Tax=Ilumatobacter sp. TaxID=1967498 RepID=UPI003919E146
MNPISSVFILMGVGIVVMAAIGLLRFSTPYARIHAAGKASPVAFLVLSIGAGIELGWSGAAQLAVASGALVLTLPMAVHLLFRAIHQTDRSSDPMVDELRRP